MQHGRLRLRPWLEKQIQSGKYPGVTWLDEWVMQHPQHPYFPRLYNPGIDKPDPKTWKANFRCALNSLTDVKELQRKSIKKGRLQKSEVDIKHSPISLSETEACSSAPLDGFAVFKHQLVSISIEVFLKYRRGQTSHNPENSDADDNEKAEAVFKIVDHLKHLEHWSQSNDNRSWRAADICWADSYCEDMDYLAYPMETDCDTHSAQQMPFL
ncbi:unnamed protein product [Coregonus sp. 'balchen']|nr:unnamed protein product [Coregonus sp. 'balchen']